MIPFGDIILPFVGVMAACLLLVAAKFFFVNGLASPRAASQPVEPVPAVVDTALEGYPSRPSLSFQSSLFSGPRQDTPTPAHAAETPPNANAAGDNKRAAGSTMTVEVTATPVADEPYFENIPDPKPDVEPEVKPKAKAPVQTKTTPPAKPSGQSWRVQVGAYGSKQAAGDIVKKLAKSGYSATVFSGPKFHKVWVQAGATKDAAEKTAARLKKLGYPGSYVVPPAAK